MSANTNLTHQDAPAARAGAQIHSKLANLLASTKHTKASDFFIVGLWTAFAAYGLAATVNAFLTY